MPSRTFSERLAGCSGAAGPIDDGWDSMVLMACTERSAPTRFTPGAILPRSITTGTSAQRRRRMWSPVVECATCLSARGSGRWPFGLTCGAEASQDGMRAVDCSALVAHSKKRASDLPTADRDGSESPLTRTDQTPLPARTGGPTVTFRASGKWYALPTSEFPAGFDRPEMVTKGKKRPIIHAF